MELSSLVAELCEIALSRISNRAEERVSSTNTRQSNSSIDDAIALGVMCSFFLFGCLMEKCFVAYLVYGQSKSAAIARPLFAEIPPAAAAIVCHKEPQVDARIRFALLYGPVRTLQPSNLCKFDVTLRAKSLRLSARGEYRGLALAWLRETPCSLCSSLFFPGGRQIK